jgi:hypothetical protein
VNLNSARRFTDDEEAAPGDTIFINPIRPYWEKFISDSPEKLLHLYVIKKDVNDKFSFKKIEEQKLYEKRYTLSIERLEKLDWLIIHKRTKH